MRVRRFEVPLYVFVLAFFVIRFAGDDDGGDRRPLPESPERIVPVPDVGDLPPSDERAVWVDLETKVQNGVGTGFAILDGATYITARHVVDGCAEVYLVSGPQGQPKARRVDIEHNRDFAVLKVGLPHRNTVALSETVPHRGDEGYMVGFPQAKPADVRATVIGTTEMRSRGRYDAREPVLAWVERERRPDFTGALSGISGGPVFNADGNVIGTVVAGAPRRGRAYSTHPHVFAETGMMESGNLHRTFNPQNFDEIGKEYRANGAVVQVYCKVQ